METERAKLRGELTLRVRNARGMAVPQWNENRVGRWIRSVLRLDLKGWLGLGAWGHELVLKNLVVDAGKAGVASRINGAGGEAAFTFVAVGTGTTAPVAGNTTLETEIVDSGLARAAGTATRVTTDVTNDTAQLDKTFSVTGTKAVTEAGILNASSAGVLLARQTFSAVNVVNGDTLQVIYKIDVD